MMHHYQVFILKYYTLYCYFICDLGTVKLLARGGFELLPEATGNTFRDTEGQLFDCSKIPYEISFIT